MRNHRTRIVVALLVVLAATAAAYWPGTHGTFLLDDNPNIVENPALNHFKMSSGALLRAAFSMHSGTFDRPLAMVSFALNIWGSGLAAGPMKITNLFIHLLNGVLVFLLMRLLLVEYRRLRPGVSERACTWTALAIAAAWLLAPINLTAVLYVVQRMTSLAATFMLTGLLLYVIGRRRLFHGERTVSGRVLMGTAALACVPLAVLVKEIGVLTLLYALVIEWIFFRLRNESGRRSKFTVGYFLVFLVAPGIAGAVWLLPQVTAPWAYAARSFTLGERLLTEGRVLWHYVYWTLVPNVGALTLYHDAFPVSRGLFSPWTTLPSWVGIAALLGTGLALRKRLPLVSFGILWFLAGQVLTATVIPLELVFEHRMYLPSLGLLTLPLAPLLLTVPQERLRALRIGAAAALIVLYGSALALRASGWSNPVLHMAIAAHEHPESPRATYGYGRLLAGLAGHDPALAPQAFAALEASMKVPGQSTTPESALILLASRLHKPVKAQWYASMVQKLKRRLPTAQDIGALYALLQCALRTSDPCRLDRASMNAVFDAALDHRPPNPEITAMYGNYLLNVVENPAEAQKVLAALSARYPSTQIYHYDLGMAALANHDLATARRELVILKQHNRLGLNDPEITKLNDFLKEISRLENARARH